MSLNSERERESVRQNEREKDRDKVTNLQGYHKRCARTIAWQY